MESGGKTKREPPICGDEEDAIYARRIYLGPNGSSKIIAWCKRKIRRRERHKLNRIDLYKDEP